MGADDRVFSVKCDCCGSVIHVDPRRRSVYYTEKVDEQSKSFEDRVTKAKRKLDPDAETKFDQALAADKDKESKLDALFKDASKKAAEDPNERPPSIWDYE